MSKSTREKSLRYLALLAACVAASNACDRPEYSYSDDVPIKGGSSFGGSVVTGGAIAIGGGPPINPCALERSVGASPVLAKHVVSNALAARAELYAQVTDSEVLALKKGGSLIPPAPATVAGTATPLSVVLTWAQTLPVANQGALAKLLLNRFKATRSTWPNPWALRLVDHVGTEHMTPLRIRLRDEAWILRIDATSFAVLDVQNGTVAVEEALAHPERIAVVYYVYDDRTAGNAVAQCENGKREFALGNETMVAEFSLGTAEILTRLNSDIDDLTGLFNVVRQCTTVDRGVGTFRSLTACQAWDFFDATTEYSAYQWSLSTPVELYKPTTQNLASLIDALKNDRFDPDPFVVAPEADAQGGVGGASEQGEGGIAQGGAGGVGGGP